MLQRSDFRPMSTYCHYSRKKCKILKDQTTESLEKNELLKTVKCLGRAVWEKSQVITDAV
jgi:hypothetical protein